MTKHLLKIIFISIYSFLGNACAQTTITLENPKVKMVISKTGATISSLSLKSQNLSPLHSYGQFICFDRWGPTSTQDQARGIPQHGEASHVQWTVNKAPTEEAQDFFSEMSCLLPVMKLKIDRQIRCDKNEAVFQITDKITNPNTVKQVFNLVQHVTIGAPFLDQTTMVNTKVDKGFWQGGTVPPTGSAILSWPQVSLGGKSLDLQYQHSTDSPTDYVVSYIFPQNQKYGWVTACNKSKKLLIGYLWLTAESPWLNVWSNTSQIARGLEFGTGGLHQPIETVLATGPIFNTPIYEYVSPDTPITKSFTGFLSEIPTDYKGVLDIGFQSDKITISEIGGNASRTIVIPVTLNSTKTLPISASENNVHVALYRKGNQAATLNIRYKLSAPTKVVGEVFSLQGKKISTFFNGMQLQGTQSIVQTLSGFPSGIYCCRLKIGNTLFQSGAIALTN